MKNARPNGQTIFLAGLEGFEPPNVGTKNRCLTTWRQPNSFNIIPYENTHAPEKLVLTIFPTLNLSTVTIDTMNIYISHSGNYDYDSELYSPIKESALASAHQFFLPHEPKNAGILAKEELQRTDILVAEVSYPSTGQGIELGLASVVGVPVACFYKAGTKPSNSLRFVTDQIIEYSSIHDLLTKIGQLPVLDK